MGGERGTDLARLFLKSLIGESQDTAICLHRTPGGKVGVGVGFSATNEEYRLVISEPRLFCLCHGSIDKHLPIRR